MASSSSHIQSYDDQFIQIPIMFLRNCNKVKVQLYVCYKSLTLETHSI